jgi:hypothetical protein
MKRGLLVYPTNCETNIFNIGDYIQSLAARQFIQRDEIVYLHREKLNQYDGEPLKTTMNGWFMHVPENWPPSESIIPNFVAFHLNSSVASRILNDALNVEYFKKYQPIGCRDLYTVSLLRDKGIDAYFSGCLTLTLGMTYKYEGLRSDKVYFVDVTSPSRISFASVMRVLYLLLFHLTSILAIYKKRSHSFSFRSFASNLFFVALYSKIFKLDVLVNAEYVEHELNDNFADHDAKFSYAEDLLQKYSKAKYVVTSRIHCALPCLGLDTPVLYTFDSNQDKISTCRMGGLLELFHVIKINKNKITSPLNTGKFTNKTDFKNKEAYIPYKENLIKRCFNFMRDAE